MTKLIILDRDGVINRNSDAYVKSVDEWIPLDGSIEAIARLSRAGYRIAIATNQSGLGRGYFQRTDLDAMHAKMTTLITAAGGELAGIYFCPHGPDDGCDCRKPQPGLVDAIARDLRVDVAGATMVGDSLRDLQAGLARACVPVLVRTGKGQTTEATLAQQNDPALRNALIFDDLAAVADHLLSTSEPQ